MDRRIIEKTIDYLLHIKGVTVVKCKPSYRPHILKVLNNYAEKYGYSITTYKDNDIYNKDALATLYDPKHNTLIEFNKDFINTNNIDWNNTGKKKIDIETIFNTYENLPNPCKDSIGLLKHTTEEEYGLFGDKAFGWSSIYERTDNMFNVVNIPASFLEEQIDNGESYEFLLAHESMHCNDYHKFTEEEMNIYSKVKMAYANGEPVNLSVKEQEVYRRVNNLVNNDYMQMDNSVGGGEDEAYFTCLRNNAIFINGGEPSSSDGWGDLSDNKASDYGVMDIREDYAEYGGMVITGLHNPSNPNSRVKFNGEYMQYEEWSKLHPYQVQYFAKELYDEDISIEEILNG